MKVYMYHALSIVALTTNGQWELTDIRESQGITVDYEKRLSQTFPDKVSQLYTIVQCIAVLSQHDCFASA